MGGNNKQTITETAETMAPLTFGLGLLVLMLLHPREGADAFVQPSAALLGSRGSASIMSMTSDGASSRAGFLDVVGSVGVGVLGLGLATERASAYEVCTRRVSPRGALHRRLN